MPGRSRTAGNGNVIRGKIALSVIQIQRIFDPIFGDKFDGVNVPNYWDKIRKKMSQ